MKKATCSQCGQSFGPGRNGFSACKQHAPRTLAQRAMNAIERHPKMVLTICEDRAWRHGGYDDQIFWFFDDRSVLEQDGIWLRTVTQHYAESQIESFRDE
jgi:hypothetical protein